MRNPAALLSRRAARGWRPPLRPDSVAVRVPRDTTLLRLRPVEMKAARLEAAARAAAKARRGR